MSNSDTQIPNQNDSALDANIRRTHYWTYAPGHNAAIWDNYYQKGIMAIGWSKIGNLKEYHSKEEIKRAFQKISGSAQSHKNIVLALWQFANEMRPGDIIFVKQGTSRLVGRGIVISDYEFDESSPDRYKHVREVKWTHCGDWASPMKPCVKTLTDITPYTEDINKLNAVFDIDESEDGADAVYPAYTEDDFLRDVFLPARDFRCLKDLLRHKKNVILMGAPGVGKTYISRRLAYAVMGEKNPERIKMIQFHQNYSYEDFIMGYRPNETGFELRHGVFYDFCKKAESDSENDYFFLIDEINRGNISKIFGELFMLIENDKRGEELQLLYSNEQFSVPDNLYLIGMMNTADRSLAMIDYALRRRFSFYKVRPGFDSDGFAKYRASVNSPLFDALVGRIKKLNQEIESSFGDGFCIGHSYLCNLGDSENIAQRLKSVVIYDILPLLEEYCFDEPDRYREWANDLLSVFHDEI